MPFIRAGQLARSTPTARLDDPLGLVAENLRASSYGAIPVLDRVVTGDGGPGAPEEQDAHVLGLVDERDLSHTVLPMLARQEAGVASAQALRTSHTPPIPFPSGSPSGAADYRLIGGVAQLNGNPVSPGEPANAAAVTARSVMRTEFGIVPAGFTLRDALLMLDHYGSLALPVVDEIGRYRGMISRADVVAALGQQVRPPLVGGMATPLGVWLTTGHINAGAPPLGLFLSGIVLACCLAVSYLALLFGLMFLNREWGQMFISGRIGAESDVGTLFNFIITNVESLLFLLVLRALPMAGIHAAEHQTVWAIERGLALTPEHVAKMPRAHPRCGTNLMALAGLILIVFRHLPDTNPGTVLFALLFIYLAWRNFGTFLQEWFTTKPATRKQLESGIKAGRALLEKYQEQPHVTTSFGMRLFNSGLLLSALGMALVLIPFTYVKLSLARWIFLGF